MEILRFGSCLGVPSTIEIHYSFCDFRAFRWLFLGFLLGGLVGFRRFDDIAGSSSSEKITTFSEFELVETQSNVLPLTLMSSDSKMFELVRVA